MKAEVTSAILLTLAVTLITMGVDFINAGQTETGIVCIIVGFGLVASTIFLVGYGVVQKVTKAIS